MAWWEERRIVLASGSRYRAELLAGAGIDAEVDPPQVDERARDHLFAAEGPEALALDLARRKVTDVAVRHPDAVVIGGDQVGVLDTASGLRQLTKQAHRRGAVDQLLDMAGTTHRLVNALVVVDTATSRSAEGIDVQVVTMRPFDRAVAESYVDRFQPFDSAGSYRLEDQDDLPPGEGLVTSVVGEDRSGVMGLPLPLLWRLLRSLSPPTPPRLAAR